MFNWRRLWPAKAQEEVVQVEEETLVIEELPTGETLVTDIEETVTMTREVQKPRRVWLWVVLGALLALGLLLWLLLSCWCRQPIPVVDNPPPPPVVTAPPVVEPPVVEHPVALPPPPPVVKPVVKPVVHHVAVVHHKARHHCR